MDVREIQAIDVHAHYGVYNNAARSVSSALDAERAQQQVNDMMSADAAAVEQRAFQSNVAITVVSPLLALMPRGGGDPLAGNDEAALVVSRHGGLRQWVVIDPLRPATYEQAASLLRTERCLGIKIHPEEHLYNITEHGDAIFSFAAEHRAIVLTHSGEERSLPADFVPFADRYPEARIILAHIGCGWDGDPGHQIRAAAQSRHGNLYADTSSARSLLPGLIEWAVRDLGKEKVLFGTDTPLYCTSMQRARIDRAEMTDDEKEWVLRRSALALFDGRL